MAVFFRLTRYPAADKAERLAERVAEARSRRTNANLFEVDPGRFNLITESPFAYWVNERVLRVFRECPPLEGNVGTVKQGLATADDFRFVRAWWEVDAIRLGYGSAETAHSRGWVHFAKGGSYSPYYADVHLVVNWSRTGAEVKAAVTAKYPYLKGKYEWVVKNEEYYFRPGLTFPRRTARLAPSAYPANCIFSHGGQAAFPADGVPLEGLLALLASGCFFELLRIRLPRLESEPQFEVGQLQLTPVPSPLHDVPAGAVGGLVTARREELGWDEASHDFGVPRYLEPEWRPADTTAVRESIDRWALEAYGLTEADLDTGEAEEPAAGASAEDDGDEGSTDTSPAELAADFVMWCVGVAFGRWDARMAKDRRLVAKWAGPFERLPRVAPGGLVGPDGLPAEPEKIASEAWLRTRRDVLHVPTPQEVPGPVAISKTEYPLLVAWDGVLVEEEGHPRDIAAAVRSVFAYLFGSQAEEKEEEVLRALRGDTNAPRTLREWFTGNRSGELGKTFFDWHIQRYSRSRRKAPIYWRMTSTGAAQAGWGCWLYYPRLQGETLWRVVGEYLRPRRARAERRVADLERELTQLGGRERRRAEGELETERELLEELGWLEERLTAILQRGYEVDRDDGVVVNMAPLHEVVPWSEATGVWEELEAGVYDWARMARRFWPERVDEKARSDRSIALAHERRG